MAIAYSEAIYGILVKHGGPFGAVIVKGESIISRAHNEVLLSLDPTAHAEIVAIRRACQVLNTVDLHDCILYSTSKPCPMCAGAIQWSRINKVFFSGGYKDTEKLNFDDLLFANSFSDIDKTWQQIDQEDFPKIISLFENYRNILHY